MRIYRPMMFVGLGGTGCRVGAELERRMREELCGPDGTRLLREKQGANYLPYQLPSCLQFVYADLSADELSKVRREVVPGREHVAAAQRTMRLMTNLIPADLSNSSDVSQRLITNLREDVVGWLPPKETDPNVGPLLKGAGQLPTVGRAVLFETMRRNPMTAVQALADAKTDINQSADDLQMVSGGGASRTDQMDVFVVFSVAGGTGSGIFYDYLHLVSEVLSDKRIALYPLVLMPSSFDGGPGGGRPAELNAGSSLIDLFRLVDDQNAQRAQDRFDSAGGHGAVSVHYPDPKGQVTMRASTMQTAFLFGRPIGGVDRDTLGRSMVSLMLSLIGAGPNAQEAVEQQQRGREDQSFADGFINSTAERFAPSDTGIGRRGVSTSSVAELTTPLQELTDVISSRLLARAVNQLTEPLGGLERNSENILRFFQAAGLDRLRTGQPTPLPTPQTFPNGYDAVVRGLNQRGQAMARNMESWPAQLREPVAKLARDFDPAAGSEAALRAGVHLFQLQRVLFGHRDMPDAIDQGGVAARLEAYRYSPAAPPGLNVAAPPQPQGLPKKSLFDKLSPLTWSNPAVQNVVGQQDLWYKWRSRQVWNAAWGDNFRLWDQVWREFIEEFEAILAPFYAHAREESELFEARAAALYRHRVGVSYLLPPRDRGLNGFYQVVFARLREDFATNLGPNANEGDLLNQIVDSAAWAKAYRDGRQDHESTFAAVRQLVKEAVAERLRSSDPRRTSLIPSMEDLLARAAGKKGSERKVSDEDLRQFRQKLAALVPGGYAPSGTAELQVLFTYPAQDTDKEIEQFLSREVALPPDLLTQPVFRAISADSMVVVLMRTTMGITEVPEVRKVMKLWSEAQRHEQPSDSIAWRRRLSQSSDYLLMTAADRKNVLHRLLSAAWNGSIKIVGDPRSPRSVDVRLGARGDAAVMTLELTALGALSSWATILQAYERFILFDDHPMRRNLALRLMAEKPENVHESNTPPAEPEFTTITDLVDGEIAKIAEAKRDEHLRRDPQLQVIEEFWTVTMPAALDRDIDNTTKNLRNLPRLVAAAQGLGSSPSLSKTDGGTHGSSDGDIPKFRSS